MRTLYLRIYATVVAVLLLFALFSGWLLQHKLEQERAQFQQASSERLQAWAELLQGALPSADAPPDEQAQALLEWSQRLRWPLALDDVRGERIATSPSFERAQRLWAEIPLGGDGALRERRVPVRLALSDGRVLWLLRPPLRGMLRPDGPPPEGPGGRPMPPPDGPFGGPPRAGPPPDERGADVALRLRLPEPPWFAGGAGLAVTLVVLFFAVAVGAWPVVRRLTRRLEALKQGVEAFGAGALHQRVDEGGRDEVAAVAQSFNRAAERIETLLRANQSLLANASHELRSPLARLKMALAMDEHSEDPAQRAALRVEIDRNIAELDALVEEVLLASRLDARPEPARDPVDLLGLAVEEGARVGADIDAQASAAPDAWVVTGDERLLRRALRNLLENARRYGGAAAPTVVLSLRAGQLVLAVCDRGPGVPDSERERIFEPFYRLAGHAERAGGVGLGLSLVRQIARVHGGEVRCLAREGGGSCFEISLPSRR
ncbi:HAMP domain-containing sensor histidine kinase [Caldimonas sp. KR1-144]|uniref:sensor histidine kinase n=1 Tax=Caldimonas sp. KR1-144 TaxID=3400911 RepID=UPI003C03F900